jgi:hypothetical protein
MRHDRFDVSELPEFLRPRSVDPRLFVGGISGELAATSPFFFRKDCLRPFRSHLLPSRQGPDNSKSGGLSRKWESIGPLLQMLFVIDQ